jgi:polysaccharide chain length determinant protein (PEP-CTERM system associated)
MKTPNLRNRRMTQRPEFHVEGASGLGPDVVVDVWRRRKWIGIAVFVIVLAGAITTVIALPNLYRASATVLIERPRVSEAFVRQSVTAELETRIQTIHRQVMSRMRLTDVINRLGLYADLRGVVPMDALAERLRREAQLSLQGVEQSTGRTETIAFTLNFSGRDPQTVARVANTLAGFYVEGNTQSRERQATETAAFLEARLADVKRELDEQARRNDEIKLRHTNELQQVEVSLTALERLNTQLRLNNESQLRALDRRERLEQQLAVAESTAPVTAPSDPQAALLLKRREDLAQLRTQFSDQYPEVIRVKAEIAALEAEAGAATNGTIGHTSATPSGNAALRFAKQGLDSVEGELRSLKEEEASLRSMITGYEARVDNSPQRQQELQQPSRDYDAVNERYQALVKQAEEARLAENLERGQNTEQFRILDPAIPPIHPAAPNRLWLLIMGMVAAVALGFGAIVAAEKLDTTFHTVDDLQEFTNLPTLARIRRIPTAARARRERLRFALMAAAAIVALMAVVAGSYYVAGGNEQIVRMTARPAL